jgi:hypothetical protein
MWVAAVTGCLFGPAAWAQPGDLPKAESILDRYVEVTGGEAAYKRMKNYRMAGTYELPAQNIRFEMTSKAAAPDKLIVELNSDAMGKVVQGTNGASAWEITQMMGPRLLEGAELAEFQREATFNGPLHWRQMYEKVECTAEEEVDGKPAHKVVLTPKEGKPVTQFFDKESGLLVRQDMVAATHMGEIPVTIRLLEYKEFDGVRMPAVTTQNMTGMQIKITVTELESNVQFEENAFEMPAEVKALQQTP